MILTITMVTKKILTMEIIVEKCGGKLQMQYRHNQKDAVRQRHHVFLSPLSASNQTKQPLVLCLSVVMFKVIPLGIMTSRQDEIILERRERTHQMAE